MTAIEKNKLQNSLCCGCECTGFVAKINYELNTSTKKVKVTDASEFDAGDDLKVVNVHVSDKNGMQKNGQITAKAGDVSVDIAGLDLSSIDVTATVVTVHGCKADLGIYKIGSTALIGSLENTNNQSTRA